jgi:hypothetical protein
MEFTVELLATVMGLKADAPDSEVAKVDTKL